MATRSSLALPSSLWSSVVVLITLPSLTVVPGTLLGKVLVGSHCWASGCLPVSILDKFREEQDRVRDDIAQHQAQAESVYAGAWTTP